MERESFWAAGATEIYFNFCFTWICLLYDKGLLSWLIQWLVIGYLQCLFLTVIFLVIASITAIIAHLSVIKNLTCWMCAHVPFNSHRLDKPWLACCSLHQPPDWSVELWLQYLARWWDVALGMGYYEYFYFRCSRANSSSYLVHDRKWVPARVQWYFVTGEYSTCT